MIGGAGEPIEQSDIMYKDDLVCILKPDVKKGIIIWTHFTQPAEMGSLCELGLKTGKQLQREGIDFGRSKIHPYMRSKIHPYMFFRAPYYSRDIDYTSVETEINSSYGEGQIGKGARVFIRVDVKPDQKIWYNLFTSQAVLFPTRASPPVPFDNQPIERNSEILVSIPHLTPDYFVLCTA